MKRAIREAINTPRHTLYAIIGFLVLCGFAYALIENKGPIEGLWWGLVTASTTGYGDYSPATTPGRFFGAVLIISMWFLNLAANAHFTKRALDDPDAFTHDEQVQARRCDDETNFLVKDFIIRFYGEDYLEEKLTEFETMREGSNTV